MQTTMWQIYSRKHLLKISIRSSRKIWAYSIWRSIEGQLKVVLLSFCEYAFSLFIWMAILRLR
jgi:hypothetical protein